MTIENDPASFLDVTGRFEGNPHEQVGIILGEYAAAGARIVIMSDEAYAICQHSIIQELSLRAWNRFVDSVRAEGAPTPVADE